MPESHLARTDYSDEELAQNFQRGERWAFDLLVRRYKDPLVNFAYRYTGNVDDAEDIIQDTFVRVYHHIDQYQPIAKFSTWIYTITSNLARTHYRKQRRWGFFSSPEHRDDDEGYERELPDTELLPDEIADGAILHEQIEQALQKLPLVFREVILLYEIEDKSYEEIAEITGMGVGTVKSRLNRARGKLQELLKDLITSER